MISLHETIDVERPELEAFDYIADFRTTTQWDSTADSARKITSGPLGVGTRFEVVCRHPLGRITLHYTITRYEPGQMLCLHGSSRFFDIDDEIRFTAIGSGTRVDYRAGFTFRQPLKYISGKFRAGLERMGQASVQGLKRALDDTFPPPTRSIKPLLARANNPRVINVVSGGMYSQRLNAGMLEASPEGYSGRAWQCTSEARNLPT